MRFQRRQGLTVDVLVGPHTDAALTSTAALLAPGARYAAPHGSARVRALQRWLCAVGERPGAIDGRFGPMTEAGRARILKAGRTETEVCRLTAPGDAVVTHVTMVLAPISIGRDHPGVEVLAVGADDQPLPHGEPWGAVGSGPDRHAWLLGGRVASFARLTRGAQRAED